LERSRLLLSQELEKALGLTVRRSQFLAVLEIEFKAAYVSHGEGWEKKGAREVYYGIMWGLVKKNQ